MNHVRRIKKMMKKCVALLLALIMTLSLCPALGESAAEALDYEELTAWVQGYKDRALAAGAPLERSHGGGSPHRGWLCLYL